jgi:hypothetical protein
MAFRTIARVERITTYAEAADYYNTVKPIRGSNVRPLGARRDADKYQMVKGGNPVFTEYYCARLYDTNVVTFYPDNTIRVKMDGYTTATTLQFISAVLGISANKTRGSCVFRVDGDLHALKGRDAELILQWQEGKLRVKQSQTHKQWAVSRTAANNVRSRVSEFRGYFKGFISLRQEMVKRWNEEVPVVGIAVQEMVDLLGTWDTQNWQGRHETQIDLRSWYALNNKTQDKYTQKMEQFYNLIRNDQPEEGKARNFYKAAVGYFAGYRSHIELNSSIPEAFTFDCADAMAGLDEILFKWFADEVFVLKDVPAGKAPSNKYDRWAGRTPESETFVTEL